MQETYKYEQRVPVTACNSSGSSYGFSFGVTALSMLVLMVN